MVDNNNYSFNRHSTQFVLLAVTETLRDRRIYEFQNTTIDYYNRIERLQTNRRLIKINSIRNQKVGKLDTWGKRAGALGRLRSLNERADRLRKMGNNVIKYALNGILEIV